MPFAHLPASASQTLRAAAAVGAAATITLNLTGLPRCPALAILIRNASRTAGTLTVSFTGGATQALVTGTPLGSDLTRAITTAEYTVIFLTGTIPPWVQITLTPSGGYDGIATVTGRAAIYDPYTLLAA